MSTVISMKALLESGVHFGHRTNKWDPAMKPFIFTERNGIHIIDLQQTVKCITTAYNLIRDTVAAGGTVCSSAPNARRRKPSKKKPNAAGMPYVIERWLGGMITNWQTMYKRIMELERLEKMRDTGEINAADQKRRLDDRARDRPSDGRLSGVRKMNHLPDLVFVVDVMREATAVHEANFKDIPVIALVDTNCDPRKWIMSFPPMMTRSAPSNCLFSKVADAVLEGKAMRKDEFVPQTGARDEDQTVSIGGLEEEISDEDILGEATLAKLSKAKEVETAAEKDSMVEEPVTETAQQNQSWKNPLLKPLK